MMTYWVKSPEWMKCFFPSGMKWEGSTDKDNETVYLTFDDGPHPSITPFVLQQLRLHNAKATFFCVGNNVARFPEVYEKLKEEGHKPANHTYNHLNGWKTTNSHYIKNIQQAARHIDSMLFRPPYGRMRLSQYRKLKKMNPNWVVYMWDILSGDFDATISPQQCADNVLAHIRPGSIILFHDSEKAMERMQFALPLVLQHCVNNGWSMNVLPG